MKLDEAKKWLLGVSGGADSMALLDMCLKRNLEIGVAHVNYHTRDTSDAEEAYVKQYCVDHQIPFFVRNEPFVYKGNFEARAREWRYSFFSEICQTYGYEGVLVAHHEDDLMETYLMQKEKEIVPSTYGLSYEREIGGILVVRPLLEYSKKDLMEYCKKHQIHYFEDSSNQDIRYKRNQIRKEQVEPLSTSERQQLLEEIQCANKELKVIRDSIRPYLEKETITEEEYLSLTRSQRFAFLREFLPKKHGSLKYFEEMDLLFQRKELLLEYETYDVVKENHTIFKVEAFQPYSYTFETLESLFQEKTYPHFRIQEGKMGLYGVTVHAEDFPLTIRNYQEGDAIQMRFGKKRVSRFFIDRHIPRYQRKRWPIVLNHKQEVILVPGLGCNLYHFSIKPSLSVIQLFNSLGGF